MVPAVIKVRYPNMRLQVLSSLESLADRAYQQRVWVEGILPHPGYGDDFALAYSWLYEDLPIMDDPPVLQPSPSASIHNGKRLRLYPFLWVHAVLVVASLAIGTTVGVLGVRSWRAARSGRVSPPRDTEERVH